jgi:hypothetical protein
MPSRSSFTAAAMAAAGIVTSLVVLAALERPAQASPRPLPVTYIYETNGEGEAEIEQYVDMAPVKANTTAGVPATTLRAQFQTEFEYGITDRLELGLYVTFVPEASQEFTNVSTMMEGNGSKQRLRYRIADEGVLPIDIGLYGEVTENERDVELEARIILQKRFGNLRAVANLVGEHEFYYNGNSDWEINPSAGLSYQITPVYVPGIEYWNDTEWPNPAVHPRPRVLGPNHYVGPAMLFDFGKLWWSTGAYLRLNDFGDAPQVGDVFGSVYFRTVIGYGL